MSYFPPRNIWVSFILFKSRRRRGNLQFEVGFQIMKRHGKLPPIRWHMSSFCLVWFYRPFQTFLFVWELVTLVRGVANCHVIAARESKQAFMRNIFVSVHSNNLTKQASNPSIFQLSRVTYRLNDSFVGEIVFEFFRYKERVSFGI